MKQISLPKISTRSSLWLLVPLVFTPHFAHAYLDPNTGSYAIQIAVGALFGAAYGFRTFSARVVSWFKGTRKKKNPDA